MLTDQMVELFNKINEYRTLVTVAILSGIAGALIQKYLLSRHVSTGEPVHVPKIIAAPAGAVAHAVEKAVEKVTGRHHAKGSGVVGQEATERKPEPDTAEAEEKASAPPAS